MSKKKKKKKVLPRIEIKTFGDISEKNINILMLVKNSFNELLASGENIITCVKIKCESKEE